MDYSATGTRRQNLREVSTISYPDDDIESEEGTGSVDSNKMTPYIIDQELTNLPAALHRAIQNSSGTFGEVNINNSKDVHIGPKIYTAPVTLEVVNARHEPRTELDCSDIIQEKGDILEHLSKAGYELVVSVKAHDLDRRVEREKIINIENSKSQKAEFLIKRRLVIIAGAVLLLIISASLTVYLATSWANNLKDGIETDELVINASWFIPRAKWNARVPVSRQLLHLPVKFAVMGHTVSHQQFVGTSDPERRQCYHHVANLQYDHMVSRGWVDLGFNYLVCGNGDVIVSRGSNAIGAFAKGVNSISFGIAFIGNYNNHELTDAQIRNTQTLLRELVSNGKLSEDYNVIPSEIVTGLDSPGRNAISVIKRWPRYKDSIDMEEIRKLVEEAASRKAKII